MKRLLLCVALAIALPGLWNAGVAKAASQPGQQASAPQTPPSATAGAPGYVGSDTCITCHAEIGKNFASNPHSKLSLMHSGKGITCESCHGPGQAHVEGGGDITKIFLPSKATAKETNATCLGCHAGVHPNFERSPHAKAGLSCISCHSVHAAQTEESLLKLPQPTLCYTCHTDVKPAFSQAFHHQVDEGLMKCSDCHDVHGTFQNTQLKSTADQNLICTKCHTETAGPFAYEHPVVKTEGCLSCHSPHGSPNPRMLNVSNVNTLCLQCHSETNLSAFPHAVSPTGPAHNQAAQYVSCTTCHTQIHGSNASAIYFK